MSIDSYLDDNGSPEGNFDCESEFFPQQFSTSRFVIKRLLFLLVELLLSFNELLKLNKLSVRSGSQSSKD